MSILYLIPTPISPEGLDNIPNSTREIARSLECFIVERGKVERTFLKSLGTNIPLQEMSFCTLHENDLKTAEHFFLEKIKTGVNIGLLSEAGCPGIADPGANIVALAHKNGIEVVPLVGPSSIIMALMASGMNGQSFCFHGYLSAKRPELAKDLKRLEQTAVRLRQTQLFIDAPYRSNQVVEVALSTLNKNTKFGIAASINSPDAFCQTHSIGEWQQRTMPNLHKQNTVFLIFGG